jgi:hypothetical protein
MKKSIFPLLMFAILPLSSAYSQGTFGQIALGGCWQTTFTLVNISTAADASGRFAFYGDGGSSISVPVLGSGNTSSYQFTIPANGSRSIVLSSSDTSITQGWASMSITAGAVRAQGTLRCQPPGAPAFEAVVPLSTSATAGCIIPLPASSKPTIIIPFDNTGDHSTALALANTTNTALVLPVEFDDESGAVLARDSLPLAAMNHTAFYVSNDYPSIAGKKGVVRIEASVAQLTVLALLFNTTGGFTTILPLPF